MSHAGPPATVPSLFRMLEKDKYYGVYEGIMTRVRHKTAAYMKEIILFESDIG